MKTDGLPGGNATLALAIRKALNRILASPAFGRAAKLKDFLRFVVEETLAGRAEELKEYTIGVRVFDRGEAFDPRLDPIVRVQAGKLRERLDRYYHREESPAPVRIALRPGGYVPAFEPLTGETNFAVGTHQAGLAREGGSPTLAVLPFLNLTGDPDFEYFSDGLSEELTGVLGRIPGLRVAARFSAYACKGMNRDLGEIGRMLRSDLVLEGSVRRNSGVIRVTALLNDVPGGHQIWARQYNGPLEDVLAFQDEIAEQIGAMVRQSVHGGPRLPRQAWTPAL